MAHIRKCPTCEREVKYTSPSNFYRARSNNLQCKSCSHTGKRFSDEHKNKLSIKKIGIKKSAIACLKNSDSQKRRYLDPEMRKKTSNATKIALHRPDVRKRHIEALAVCKFLKVRTDKGQLELLEKWNRLGFNFEPNYQLKTDTDLFYIDGYDPIKNIVIEYDSIGKQWSNVAGGNR